MKKFILSLLIVVASAMSASVYAKPCVYEGSIGEYKIHMVLDDNNNGYYYYDHRPKSRFKLVKTRVSKSDDCDGMECITLQEYAPGTKKNTGEFVGTIYYGQEFGVIMITFAGTFRNKSTGKTFPFEVMYFTTYSTDL